MLLSKPVGSILLESARRTDYCLREGRDIPQTTTSDLCRTSALMWRFVQARMSFKGQEERNRVPYYSFVTKSVT